MADDSDTYPNIFGPLSPQIYSAFRKRLGLTDSDSSAPSPATAPALTPENIVPEMDPAPLQYLGHVANKLASPFLHRVFGPQSPGAVMQEGAAGNIPTTEEMVPWAANTALATASAGSPFATRGAAGVAGGKLITPTIEQRVPANPQTVQPLTVNEILHPDYPAVTPRSQNVEDIAQGLHDRGSKALTNLGVPGGTLTGPSDYDDHLAHAIASEVQGAMQRSGHAGDWYTDKVREAQSVASLLHPEIATDPNARFAWNAGLAATSQGETVPSNVRLANQVMQHYRENGRFPTNIVAKNGPAMNNNFGKLNDLIDEMGVDGARQFMDRKFTVRDLEAMGHDIGGENKNTMVHGSAILGPKIGGGFYQNLNGNYDPTTMDLWFMRGWGRLTGTLVGRPPEKPIARFQQALRDTGVNDVPESREDLLAKAGDVIGTHERDFAQNRPLYDSGERNKSELTYSAERAWKALKGINEQPTSGGQRNWIRNVWNRARDILGDQGHNITNADMQALWWYPEKDLYAKMGGIPSKGINVDYSTALQDAARKAGHSEDAIQGALSAAHRGSGPAAAANVAGGEPLIRAQGRGAYAEQGLPQIGQAQ
jgi:hypothetical protein